MAFRPLKNLFFNGRKAILAITLPHTGYNAHCALHSNVGGDLHISPISSDVTDPKWLNKLPCSSTPFLLNLLATFFLIISPFKGLLSSFEVR